MSRPEHVQVSCGEFLSFLKKDCETAFPG
jgi:hypothetical protein